MLLAFFSKIKMIGYIIIIIFLIIVCIFSTFKRVKCDNLTSEYNKNLEKENLQLIEEKEKIIQDIKIIQDECDNAKNIFNTLMSDNNSLRETIESEKQQLKDIDRDKTIIKNKIDSLLDQEKAFYDRMAESSKIEEENLARQKRIAEDAFNEYKEALEKKHKEYNEEYNNLNKLLEKAYDDKHNKLIAESAKEEEELAQIRNTRAAAIEAIRREKEIIADSTFYCLQISDEDKADISKLEGVKKTLHKPRILSMLIWSTYFQKELKTLSANILGGSVITGIYKITNIITGEVYIGQAVDIAKRWSEHAKCGLGIDTPQGNKLYKAMQEYGLTNFSWELLEKCNSAELNAKERFYIDLYQSVDFGYNITKGNN